MKLDTFLPLLLITTLICGCTNSDRGILLKLNDNLQEMKTVRYQHKFENYNFMTGELGINKSATAVFEFTSSDSIVGARYFFSETSSDVGYNGLTTFFTDNKKNVLVYRPVKSYEGLVGISRLQFSIQQLRTMMPQLLGDTSVHFITKPDTLIDDTECFKFNIRMKGKKFKNGLLVSSSHLNRVRNWALMIDKKNNLPRQFIEYYEDDSPIWIITYNDFDFSNLEDDSLFNYTERNQNYLNYSTKEYRQVMERERAREGNNYIGTKAMDWTLPSMKGDSVYLSKIESKLTMLEFWFRGCTGCIAAIPDINEIQNTYKDKGLQVYGIEFTKSDSARLGNYIQKNKYEYPTLYSGKQVALEYGVSAAPAIYIVNKEGKFVYASIGFRKGEIIKAIEENI